MVRTSVKRDLEVSKETYLNPRRLSQCGLGTGCSLTNNDILGKVSGILYLLHKVAKWSTFQNFCLYGPRPLSRTPLLLRLQWASRRRLSVRTSVKRDLETDLLRSKRDLLALAYTPEMYESGQRSQLVCAVRFEYFPAGHACGHHRDDVCVRECVCVSVRV